MRAEREREREKNKKRKRKRERERIDTSHSLNPSCLLLAKSSLLLTSLFGTLFGTNSTESID